MMQNTGVNNQQGALKLHILEVQVSQLHRRVNTMYLLHFYTLAQVV